MHITFEDILGFDKQYRTNLINGLSGIKSAFLIGTTNAKAQHNLAIFSNVVHIGANPPLLGFIHRPVSVEKHTYENIKANGKFTLNHVPEALYKAAHQSSARYDRSTSEFEACGFTPWFSEKHSAPYVLESPIKIGLNLEEEIEIKSNQTLLIIGKVEEIWIAEQLLHADGFIEINNAQTALVHGLETYFKPTLVERLPYAKAN
jgi:flavin reductase (DIM6/NTAB) family NADH-FMN oxidoreductase RutF